MYLLLEAVKLVLNQVKVTRLSVSRPVNRDMAADKSYDKQYCLELDFMHVTSQTHTHSDTNMELHMR